jgi:hypothetical protein
MLLLFSSYPTTEIELGFDKIRLLVLYSVTLYLDFTKAFFAFGMSCGIQDTRINVILFRLTKNTAFPPPIYAKFIITRRQLHIFMEFPPNRTGDLERKGKAVPLQA